MLRKPTILLLAFAAAITASAATKRPNVLDIKQSITDNAIVFPESFETNTQKLLEGWYMKNYTATDSRYATVADADTPDDVIVARLKALPTIIEMPFNQVVRSYIDRYTKGGRANVAAILGLSIYYLPIFEQALEEQGLPLELKYLPMIESGLDPNAVSRHGAAGLWQFMLPTAKGLGLEVNSLVDERRDPYLSSEKAAAYLKDLYEAYGDWSLAIAAYNCGPGTVNKALRRAGGDAKTHDFWSIYNYLPQETRGYVPMFIAANYVMAHHADHNISPVLPTKPLITDTIGITDRVHFEQISNVLNIPIDELRVLNPQFRADIVPATPEHTYSLILPSQQVHAYIVSRDAILNYNAANYARRDVVQPGEASAAETLTASEQTDSELQQLEDAAAARSSMRATTHKVLAGETLASISKKYGVSQADIKRWNHLRRNAVRTGQQLRIMTAADNVPAEEALTAQQTPAASEPAAPAKTSTAKKSTKSGTTSTARAATTHNIKSGETLGAIARKYGTTVDAIKKANGMTSDNIRAGKTLKIPAGKSSGASKSSTSSKKKSTRKRRR